MSTKPTFLRSDHAVLILRWLGHYSQENPGSPRIKVHSVWYQGRFISATDAPWVNLSFSGQFNPYFCENLLSLVSDKNVPNFEAEVRSNEHFNVTNASFMFLILMFLNLCNLFDNLLAFLA